MAIGLLGGLLLSGLGTYAAGSIGEKRRERRQSMLDQQLGQIQNTLFQNPNDPMAQSQALMQMQQLGMSPQAAQSILSPFQQQQPDPTGLMRNIAATGVQPGTPEYQDMMRQAIMKPQVAVNQFPAPPSGYAYKNPERPMEGLVAITGGPATKPTKEEAQNITQGEMAEKMLSEIEAVFQSGMDVSDPRLWAETEIAQLPVLSWLTNLNPDEAKLTSNLEQFENLYMAMMRGAQVGPEEQRMFRKQLPKIGQSKEIFEENLRNSQRNLQFMMQRMKDLRQISQPSIRAPSVQAPAIPPLPPGFVIR